MLKNCFEDALTLSFIFLLYQKLRILLHLCDISVSVSSGCGRLDM